MPPINEEPIEYPIEEPMKKVVTKVDGAKTYVITSRKDEPTDRTRVEITETVTRNEKKFSGTITDLDSELERIDREIARLTSEKDAKLALKAELEAKLAEAVDPK